MWIPNKIRYMIPMDLNKPKTPQKIENFSIIKKTAAVAIPLLVILASLACYTFFQNTENQTLPICTRMNQLKGIECQTSTVFEKLTKGAKHIYDSNRLLLKKWTLYITINFKFK